MVEHLYIHIPFCRGRKCLYCALYSECGLERYYQGYAKVVARELELVVDSGVEVVPRTVYIGGGTPGVLGVEGLTALADGLSGVVDLGGVGEWSVELHPGVVTADLLECMGGMGVNRLSFGVQSFNDATLAAMGRGHSAAEAVAAIILAQEVGFDDVGLDLIAGLPGEDMEGWRHSLQCAMGLGLVHLSVYGLGVESGSALEGEVERGEAEVPGDEYQLEALAVAEEALGRGGFVRYEVSNYALPGSECRHNLGIWRSGDYLGLGCGAASRVGCRRWSNSVGVAEYIERLERGSQPECEVAEYDRREDAVERVVHRLRLQEGIVLAEVEERYPVLRGEIEGWRKRIAELSRHGIAVEEGGRLRLTPRGFEVSDSVISMLFS